MCKCHTSDSNLGKGSVYFAVREVVLSECVNVILVVPIIIIIIIII